jgi:hypothetical protein
MTMSIRIKLARLLAPEVFRQRDIFRQGAQEWETSANDWSVKAMRRMDTLRAIAAQRTERANGTVRRICAMAETEINR